MPQTDILCLPDRDLELLDLIRVAPLPTLTGPSICQSTTDKIEGTLHQLGLAGKSSEAGLWLLAGQLDRSHSVSQELHHTDGSYWHGIMHRAEGDYWNAKYWMRKASRHSIRQPLVQQIQDKAELLLQSEKPALQQLFEQVRQLLNSPETVAESLIDLVERAVTKQTEWTQPLQIICWWEWQLLFQHSYDR
jgi:hypothetical protein